MKKSKITSTVRKYLRKIVCEFWNTKGSDMDITEIVPLNLIKQDKEFFYYLKNSNDRYSSFVHKIKLTGIIIVESENDRSRHCKNWSFSVKIPTSSIHDKKKSELDVSNIGKFQTNQKFYPSK